LSLELCDLTRRGFLQCAGVLVVGFSAGGLIGPQAALKASAQEGARATANQLDSWIAVGGDGVVTAYTGKCELGQGMQTAQIQLIAEELAVAVTRVRLVQCDTALTPDQGTTSGSSTSAHPASARYAPVVVPGAELFEERQRLRPRLDSLHRSIRHVGGGLAFAVHRLHVGAL